MAILFHGFVLLLFGAAISQSNEAYAFWKEPAAEFKSQLGGIETIACAEGEDIVCLGIGCLSNEYIITAVTGAGSIEGTVTFSTTHRRFHLNMQALNPDHGSNWNVSQSPIGVDLIESIRTDPELSIQSAESIRITLSLEGLSSEWARVKAACRFQ